MPQANLGQGLLDGAWRVLAPTIKVNALLLERHPVLGGDLLLQRAHRGFRRETGDPPRPRRAAHADDKRRPRRSSCHRGDESLKERGGGWAGEMRLNVLL